uniref:Uncharacterized protein n=1 Tax=Grammatophora oceanica TaxID=210454 RepID=A0A7S1UNY1_9STRA|mmetsp:Transcript_15108/g.22145  ORF Transcript_15108/g.22145 Transcript_15108/m.22145 type:complete len:732 (+) Transcript_15108:265-2460(+)|eukprot:CAMPEP_0194041120 /NCGR_PEP_ID=MMETSP0009_2-20130614/13018_1 /TAXON_ID=210454 /ORGANISM="Grammatophora oceanica, Strain CCMP 410" /LENGTH=731 /DNA_ID=CAMNT_0038684485 /DNA_START=181 /DNA_END=2376 /DNA_ORIENTATION=+
MTARPPPPPRQSALPSPLGACPQHPGFVHPTCPTCGAWNQIEVARQKLNLVHERLTLDKQLLKAEKKNHRRAAKQTGTGGSSAGSAMAAAAAMAASEAQEQLQHKDQELTTTKQELDIVRTTMQQTQITLTQSHQAQVTMIQRQHEQEIADLQHQLELQNQENNQILEMERRLHARAQQQSAASSQDTARVGMLQQQLQDQQTTQEVQLEELKQSHQQELEQLQNTHNAEVLALRRSTSDQWNRQKTLYEEKIVTLQQELQSQQLQLDSKTEQLKVELETKHQAEMAKQITLTSRWEQKVQELQEAVEKSRGADGLGKRQKEICVSCQEYASQLRELEVEMQEMKEEHDQLVTSLTSKNESMERQLEANAGATVNSVASAKEAAKLRQQLLALEAQVQTLEKEKRDLTTQLQRLNGQSKQSNQLEELQRHLEDVQKKQTAFLRENPTVQIPTAAKLASVDVASDRIKTAEELTVDATRLLTQLDATYECVSKLEAQQRREIAKLKNELNQTTDKAETVASATAAAPTNGGFFANGGGVPASSSQSRDERIAPLTKRDGSNHHVIELDYQGEKQSGRYTGWVNSKNIPNGRGCLRVDNGDVYEGEWNNGIRHGLGVYTWYEGDLYTGPWLDGRRHGHGTFVYSDGRLYDGEYIHGKRQGKGVFTWPFGAKFEGEYEGDKRNGTGLYVYADGRQYSGSYKDDRPHGYGVEKDRHGRVAYDGEWAYGEFVGDDK